MTKHWSPRPAFNVGPFRSRGYLPHDDRRGLLQLVTIAAADRPSRPFAPPIGAAVMHDLIAAVGPPIHDVQLVTWIVMPDHVHFVLRTGASPLGVFVGNWKRSSALQFNRSLRRNGPVWSRDYHDRRLAREGEDASGTGYVEANPVRARLCNSPLDWPYSGIHRRLGREASE